MAQLDIAVFASGGGSNFESIAGMISRERVDANIQLVISNNENAYVFERAEKRNIPTYYLNPNIFKNQDAYSEKLLSILKTYHVNFIILAGYLKLIPQEIVRAFHHRIINIHPALLPSFGGKGMYGMNVHKAVLDYGCKISGATVHIVSEEYDRGPPILQECVPVKNDDTPETLAKRVLEVEHQIFPEAVKLFVEDRVKVEGRKVIIKK